MIHIFPDHVALLVVDLLKDFCEDGALAVFGGNHIAPRINDWQRSYRNVLTSREEHPENHTHFSNAPKFEDGSWPTHCVVGTPGCQYNDAFIPASQSTEFVKGTDPELHPYSSFDGKTTHRASENYGIEVFCQCNAITHLHICGLATNYCVQATVLDGLKLGFQVSLLLEGCRGIHPFLMEDQSSIFKMAAAGALVAANPEALRGFYG
jgi:nicotinamidase/pyrazinamidase